GTSRVPNSRPPSPKARKLSPVAKARQTGSRRRPTPSAGTLPAPAPTIRPVLQRRVTSKQETMQIQGVRKRAGHIVGASIGLPAQAQAHPVGIGRGHPPAPCVVRRRFVEKFRVKPRQRRIV